MTALKAIYKNKSRTVWTHLRYLTQGKRSQKDVRNKQYKTRFDTEHMAISHPFHRSQPTPAQHCPHLHAIRNHVRRISVAFKWPSEVCGLLHNINERRKNQQQQNQLNIRKFFTHCKLSTENAGPDDGKQKRLKERVRKREWERWRMKSDGDCGACALQETKRHEMASACKKGDGGKTHWLSPPLGFPRGRGVSMINSERRGANLVLHRRHGRRGPMPVTEGNY